MKIKFSGLGVVDGRGKINGTVASKSRSGAYARVKVSGTNPQTAAQLEVRNRLTFFSQAWRALSAAAIASWNAATAQWQRTNVFGDNVSPTGKNLYTRLNANIQSVGGSTITTPPQPLGAQQVVAGALVMTNGGAKTIAYTGTTVLSTVQVWATAPQSAGVRFLKNKYRLIGTFLGNASSPVDISTMYEDKFGEPPVGSYVGVKLVAIRLTTGENSLPSEATTTTV